MSLKNNTGAAGGTQTYFTESVSCAGTFTFTSNFCGHLYPGQLCGHACNAAGNGTFVCYTSSTQHGTTGPHTLTKGTEIYFGVGGGTISGYYFD